MDMVVKQHRRLRKTPPIHLFDVEDARKILMSAKRRLYTLCGMAARSFFENKGAKQQQQQQQVQLLNPRITEGGGSIEGCSTLDNRSEVEQAIQDDILVCSWTDMLLARYKAYQNSLVKGEKDRGNLLASTYKLTRRE